MEIIALEEHFWTPAIRDALRGLPPERQDTGLGLFGERFDEALLDLGSSRLRRMDAAGIDRSILSVTTPGTQALEASEATPLAREANDALAQAVKAHPDRFLGFATLPTADPSASALEFERCVRELGFVGAMINGRTGGKYLDHPDFLPLFEAAAALEVPVYVHPQSPPKAVQEAYYGGFDESVGGALATSGWGWHVETAVHSLRMVLAGLFDRLPRLKIILGHWGEIIPLYLQRVDTMSHVTRHLRRPVADYFRENFYATPGGIYDVPMLLHVVETLGVDRILFASDDPFVPVPPGTPRAFLENAPLSPADREKIANGNARRLLRLGSPQPAP